MEFLDDQIASAKRYGNLPPVVLPGSKILDLKTGYIPLLSTFTQEDKAAKGLRKGKTEEQKAAPIFYSALELVRDNKYLFLAGESGSGKTTFAKAVCHWLVNRQSQPVTRMVVRNEAGDQLEETWDHPNFVPCYFTIASLDALRSAIERDIPNLLSYTAQSSGSLLIILDDIDKAGGEVGDLIADLLTKIMAVEDREHRLLLLGNSDALYDLDLPEQMTKHSISPLLLSQRRYFLERLSGVDVNAIQVGIGSAAANASIFALAVHAGGSGVTAEQTVDQWFQIVLKSSEVDKDPGTLSIDSSRAPAWPVKFPQGRSSMLDTTYLLQLPMMQDLLLARYLAAQDPQQAMSRLPRDRQRRRNVIRSVLARVVDTARFETWAAYLLEYDAEHRHDAALRLAEYDLSISKREEVTKLCLTMITGGSVPLSRRLGAGSALSRLGDPRDLMALVYVPSATLTMGTIAHANSQPVHEVSVDAFFIGVYPVNVWEYDRFVHTTGRQWHSPEKENAEKQNCPATDVSWYDAVAYCQWLTRNWRDDGTIQKDHRVRLPTEPEWELAAKGLSASANRSQIQYPWNNSWTTNACNSDEVGLNRPCAVGIFPEGISPYGCHDMAGNIWEWCSTLWGEDMASPTFKYPYKSDDGRENADVESSVRRVLRGGCFSSGKLKANCTYRGSLEANGRWRGNGFRIVVAPIASHGE